LGLLFDEITTYSGLVGPSVCALKRAFPYCMEWQNAVWSNSLRCWSLCAL